jgi:hypothetical protein
MPILAYKNMVRLPVTGQATQYSSKLDDGYYHRGVVKSYAINTTGAQAGTSNVDLAHYTSGAGAVTFNNAAHTIVDTGAGFAQFKTGDVILTDSANNPGPFTITTGNVAGTITCTGATFVNETPAGTVTIKKRSAFSNNTVLDNNTGLTWIRYVNSKFGVASDGNMPWSGQIYDIFQYCAAANAVSLGGYSDWRIPNVFELSSIENFGGASNAVPDATAFPSWPVVFLWTSTTPPSDATRAIEVYFYSGSTAVDLKTSTARQVGLVRG